MTPSWKNYEGQRINDTFPLHRYLGGNGNHAVFLTQYGEPTPQKAAIKIILGDPERTEPQLQVWNLVANLSHPHLIRVLTTGRSYLSDRPLIYLLMEYANENLSEVIPARPLAADEAREMLKPVLSALAYIHGRGFSHGHLTPANILAMNDRLGISSDNLCRIGDASTSRTPDAYTPPEIGGITPAGDVWSLGMTLVETLTQHLPARLIGQNEPVIPEILPAQFLEIARNCLRSDPARRWTVTDIARRLEVLEASGTERRAVKAHARSRTWLSVLAASLAVALSAIAIAPRLLKRQTTSQHISETPSIHPKQITVPPSPEQKRTMPQDPAPLSSGAREPEPTEPSAKASSSDFGPRKVLHQVLPVVPSKARQTIQGKVKVSVRVHVDPSGSVTFAKLDSAAPSKYFARLALEAARRWRFSPVNGTNHELGDEWILRFEFFRTDTKVVPVHLSPRHN